MRRRLVFPATAAVLAVLCVAAYWWWSPRLVVQRMQQAGTRGDFAFIAAHVDQSALRENLRAQFAQALAGHAGDARDNALSALGNSIGMAFVNPLVDVMVRPQTIGSALQTGRVRPGAPRASGDDAPVNWELERDGADRAVFRPRRHDEAPDPKANSFVFVRRGFANWQLVEIGLQLGQ